MDFFYHVAYTNNKIDELRWDVPGTGWRNTEYRSFNFVDLNHDQDRSSSSSVAVNSTQTNSHMDDYENATLRETAESRDSRGKAEPQHGREKQSELFNAAMQGWEDQGMQNPNKVGKEDEDGEDDEQDGLVRVLTKDSENVDMKSGEAPATDTRADAAAADTVAKESERRKSVSVAA